MINYRFLNYKKYSTFEQDLSQISDDSIVFIQDKSCIWARGHLYQCEGAGDANLNNGTLVFKDGLGDVVFTITLEGSDIILRDSSGNESRTSFVLKGDLQHYVTIDKHNQDLNSKQNILQAGYGIDITNDVVSSTLDTEVYVIVSRLPNTSDANPNKIYLLETNNGDGTYRYVQYRIRNGQWVSFDAVMPTIDLSGYYNKTQSDNRYQPKGNYLTQTDLAPYFTKEAAILLDRKFDDYVTFNYAEATYQKKGNYADRDYVDDTFVKKIDVYTPQYNYDSSSGSSEEGGTITPVDHAVNIIVDSQLSTFSANPVQNRVITVELNNKVDRSELSQLATKDELETKASVSSLGNYALKSDINNALNSKQDVLVAGRGIDIINNVISTNLDTNLFVIVSQLPDTNIDENKIYILEQFDEDSQEYVYEEFRWANGDWRSMGRRGVDVDLTDYITYQNADQRYQRTGDYLTSDQIEELYQPQGDYVTEKSLGDVIATLKDAYQPIGNYADVDSVRQALEDLQTIIDTKYVLKKDVYNPQQGSWGSSDSEDIEITPAVPVPTVTVDSKLSLGSSNPVENKVITAELNNKVSITSMVTLTTEQYEALVSSGEALDNVYYFTYEGEYTSWTFGDQFPITLL